jgi:hypothetical protein
MTALIHCLQNISDVFPGKLLNVTLVLAEHSPLCGGIPKDVLMLTYSVCYIVLFGVLSFDAYCCEYQATSFSRLYENPYMQPCVPSAAYE